MLQIKDDVIEVGSLPPYPPACVGPSGAVFCHPTPSWASKVCTILAKGVMYAAWAVLGMAVALGMVVVIILLRFIIHSLLESNACVQWGPHSIFARESYNSTVSTHSSPSQSALIRDFETSTPIAHRGPLHPILQRYHNWSDCPEWPETEKCKQKICKLDFAADCRNETELWECKVCFSDKGEASWADDALAEHCCAAKRKAEIVWISIGSTFGLVLLLALGGCMLKQTRDKRRARERDRAIRLQDRELGAACGMPVDGADGTVRWTKSSRRVPVLPVSRTRTSSATNTVDPSTIRARQGSRGSSGSHATAAGPSSVPAPS